MTMMATVALVFAVVLRIQPPDGPVKVIVEDEDLDAAYRELIVGTWHDEYKGKRTLFIRPDGTATMIVEPDGLNAIFAQRLVFEEEWEIKNIEFRLKAIGGEPKSKVNLILETMGRVSRHKILELSENRLHLLDSDGQTEYDWKRDPTAPNAK